jgi:AcrR family transcriptional regulator
MPDTEAKLRLLHVAEALFSERGYKLVTLQHIADALGIKQASLYFHFPDGKEQLYVAVMERAFARHRVGLETAIASAGETLEGQLRAAVHWLLSQPVLGFGRMMSVDMPAISAEAAARLSAAGYQAVLLPLESAFRRAHEAGQICASDCILLAGSLLAIVESIHHLPELWRDDPKHTLMDTMIDVFLNGLYPR